MITTMSLLSDHDLYLFNEGSHVRLYEQLGAHPRVVDGKAGTNFAVWAPDAEKVYVMGDFNGWNKTSHRNASARRFGNLGNVCSRMSARGNSYKYHVVSRYHDYSVDKADPFAFHAETPPNTASIVWDLSYEWHDRDWMAEPRSNEVAARAHVDL